MRVRKLLKVTGITVLSLTIVGLLLVAFLLFNPFEGSLASIKDVVPRKVDFFLRKTDLLGDFEGQEDRFPNVPALSELLSTPEWRKIMNDPIGRDLRRSGVESALRQARRAFKDLNDNYLHLVNDVIGREVLLAGRFVAPGFDNSEWCAYADISWRVKSAFSLLGYGYVQEELRKQGISVEKVPMKEDLYKMQLPGGGQDLYVTRWLNCLMVANHEGLAKDSLEAAIGGPNAPESLTTSSHYIEGVDRALADWQKRAGVENPNPLEIFLRPTQMLPLMPSMRGWPNPKAVDRRNERISSMFINLESWRFLSGALLFEPNSLSVTATLEVDSTKHTQFQKEFFKTERDERSKWMNAFLGMVPANSVAAVTLRMPAGSFLQGVNRTYFEPLERKDIDDLLRQTGQYKSMSDLIDKVKASFLPRVGIVFIRNVRDAKFREYFPVQQESALPQWAWVFWIGKGRAKPVRTFVTTLKKHMGAFAFTKAYKLSLLEGSNQDVAFEFANSLMPGTGAVAVCTYEAGRGEAYFIVSNSGDLIKKMINARLRRIKSIRALDDFAEFQSELPDAVNGFIWLHGPRLREVLQDLLKQSSEVPEIMDAVWAREKRPFAEGNVFRRKYASSYSSIARIPGSMKPQFQKDVDKELDEMWKNQGAGLGAEDRAMLQQGIHLTQALRSLYLQVILEPHSLHLTGRVLTKDYR